MNTDCVKFNIGESVYYRPDSEGAAGIVVEITFSQCGCIYTVAWSDFIERTHYECELSSERIVASV